MKTTTMTIESGAFADGQVIPRRHTADGEDVSPALRWSGVPAEARELALICDDPDAPRSTPWVHWVVYRIPVDAGGLAESLASDEVVGGIVHGRNSWQTTGYRGPAPPAGHGVHHYRFRLYALDAPLDVGPGLDKDALLDAMGSHVIAEGELVGTYRR